MAVVRNSNPHGPLDPGRLADFEADFGVPLPEDNRRLLLAHNGGELVPDELVRPGEDEPFSSIGPLLGLHNGPQFLDEILGNVEGDIPADSLPFAEDAGGNLLCLVVRAGNLGTLYFWEHGRADPEAEAPGWDGMTLLAGSFAGFVAALGGPQPGAVEVRGGTT
jgi:hypothetical protein